MRHAADFAHLTTVMMVRLARRLGAEVSGETRYYISRAKTSAARLLRHKRSHWRIENWDGSFAGIDRLTLSDAARI